MKNFKYIIIVLVVIILAIILVLLLNKNKESERVYNADGTAYVIDKESPEGFAGSSQNEVVIYNNKEAYLVVYDGNNNINKEKLIAKNIDSVQKKEDGGVKIIGKDVEVLDISTEWIEIVDINNWKIVYRYKLEEIKDELNSTDKVTYYLEDTDSDGIPELIVKKNSEYLFYKFEDNSLTETEGFSGTLTTKEYSIDEINF